MEKFTKSKIRYKNIIVSIRQICYDINRGFWICGTCENDSVMMEDCVEKNRVIRSSKNYRKRHKIN